MTFGLGALSAFVVFAAAWQGWKQGETVQGLLVRKTPQEQQWRVFDEAEVSSGATIPANTNVVFHLPSGYGRISRDVLFGLKDKQVRYWGYCFKQNYDAAVAAQRQGLRGLVYLSKKEQDVQDGIALAQQPRFSLSRLPTKEELKGAAPTPAVRAQISTFEGGMLCYVMSESSLSFGLDPDQDRLNDSLESEIGTNTIVSDTDADGILDGVEHATGTDPLRRDTDGDGLIDGVEDKDWDGKWEKTETDPRKKDSDRDDLCDGFCRVRLARGREAFVGEDRNLNGIIDKGETDPLLEDTDGDGIVDFQEFLNCLSSDSDGC